MFLYLRKVLDVYFFKYFREIAALRLKNVIIFEKKKHHLVL